MREQPIIEPLQIPTPPGQRLYRFANGYGASVISTGNGSHQGLLELAVVRWSGNQPKTVFDTPVTSDVIGHLDEDQVQNVLRQIRDLPAPTTA